MKKFVAQVVVGLPVEGPFDYSIDPKFQEDIQIGSRVRVIFNHVKRVGFVVGFLERSTFDKIHPILAVLDANPSINPHSLELTNRMSKYYGCSWGEAIEASLPPGLRKDRLYDPGLTFNKDSSLTAKQAMLIVGPYSKERRNKIYEQIEIILKKKRSVIFLVPEISYIDPLFWRLKKKFSVPIISNEKTTSVKTELDRWKTIRQQQSCIVIGTRSAIFAPCQKLGLIVIDEEDHESYKQEQSPYYHALKIALLRSEIEKADLILTSCSPSLESWHKAITEKWNRITIAPESKSAVQTIDMSNYKFSKMLISFPLQNNIIEFLNQKKRVLLYFNRRGFSRITRCNQCGYVVQCDRCQFNLIYLYTKKQLNCIQCGFNASMPKFCPKCKSAYMRSLGSGIEKLQSEVARMFPQALIKIFDKDSDKIDRATNLIVATSAILRKREDFHVDLLAVLDFDSELNRFDFRAAHKAFSLIYHLREMVKEKIIIQTQMMDNYCVNSLKDDKFEGFYTQEEQFREQLGYPPFNQLIAVNVRGVKEDQVFTVVNDVYKRFKEQLSDSYEVLDPHADVHPKLRDKFRHTIVLKVKDSKSQLTSIKSIIDSTKNRSNVVITMDVDP